MNNRALEQSILKTLLYFDLFNYPLTKEELWGFLWQPPAISFVEFSEYLDNYAEADWSVKHGYYFLPGRESVIDIRQAAAVWSDLKMALARRGARLIRAVPFVRAVFVCNTVGAGMATAKSDVDFFIITEKKRIWITRLLVTGWLGLFRLRRSGARANNKICLSFYVTSDNLNLAPYRVADDDIHFAYWLNQMIPLYDPSNFFERFLNVNNWAKKYLPNLYHRPIYDYVKKVDDTRWGVFWKSAWERMWSGLYGDLIDEQAKKIQLIKMKYFSKKVDRWGEKGVIIANNILKFHEHDTRAQVRRQWQERVDVVLK